MRKSFAKLLTMVALVGAVAVIPSGAQAGHCADTGLFLFTFVGGQFDAAQNNLVCIADPDDEIYDTRLIKPGSTIVVGRLVRACVAGATLPGTMAGIVDSPVTFACSATIDGTPGTVMDTEDVEIDPLASGTITLSVTVPSPAGDVTRTTCYHTVDTECPDMPLA